MAKPGRGFKIFISFVLLGIFLELLAILNFLSDGVYGGGNVGVVELLGTIDDSRPTLDSIKKYVDDPQVKAIVLRVDSPGGAVGSSQEIHDAVQDANKKKKVVVSMGNVAASGGYYVALPASKIVADPGVITGSIGVISHFIILEDLLKKAHIKWEVIKSGDVKDMGSPFRSLTEKEKKLLQSMTDDIHLQFIEAVAKGRKMSLDKVRELADGRVFSGRQAQKLGLVDELGGLNKAIELAASLAHVEGEAKPIYPKREHFSWLRRLSEGKVDSPFLKVEYRFMP